MNKVIGTYLKGDYIIWLCFIILNLWSIYLVDITTQPLVSRWLDGDLDYYTFKVIAIIIMSISGAWVVHHINYMHLIRLFKILLWISLPLMVYAWQFGTIINEASRWVTIPYLNIAFSPNTLAKLMLVVVISNSFVRNYDSRNAIKESLLPSLLWVGIVSGLIAFTNVSAALMLYGICMLIFFLYKVPVKYILSLNLVGFVAGLFAIMFGQRGETSFSRIENFFSDELPFQTKMAFEVIHHGGITGIGPDLQASKYLPNPYSDFIFASIIESHGIIGGMVAISLMVIIVYRIFAKKKITDIQRAPAAGIGILLIGQSLINVLIVVGLLPVAGIGFPFLGMSGTSSIIIGSLGIGMIQSCMSESD